MRPWTFAFVLAVTSAPALLAQDTSFAAMQRRGKEAMHVDQYTSTHKFDTMPDGGRIELQRNGDDSAGIAAIRKHMRAMETAFERGDFSSPDFVHGRVVPGTKVMAAKHTLITYQMHELPRGAELHIHTSDPQALAAIHEFMAFQRSGHHAGGMKMPLE